MQLVANGIRTTKGKVGRGLRTRRWRAPTSLLAFVLGTIGTLPEAAASERDTKALLGRYCVSCHNDKDRKGKLSLEQFGARQWSDQGLLDAIAQMVAEEEMPPDNAKLPMPAGAKTKLLESLTPRLRQLGEASAPGTYQKLTAAEYNHTLLDLFGEALANPGDLPVDAEGEMKKVSERQVITSYAVDKYFEVARDYLDRVILVDASKPITTTYSTADTRDVQGTNNVTPAAAMAGDWDKYHRNRSFRLNIRNPAATYALEGEYELEFDWHCFYLPPELGLRRADTFGYHSLGSRTPEPTPPERPEYGYHSATSSKQDEVKWVQVDLGAPTEIAEVVYIGCHDDYGGIGAGFGFPQRYKIELSDDPEFEKGVTLLVDRTGADVANPGVDPQRAEPDAPAQARFVRFTATRLANRINTHIFALAELQVLTATGDNAAAGAEVTALDSIEAPVRWRRSNLVDGHYPGAPAVSGEAVRWVQVDLGEPAEISRIALRPCHRPYPRIGAGYGFPLRFAVDASADGENWTRLADQTAEDFPNPGMDPFVVETDGGEPARYVRVSVTKLPEVGGEFAFALAELEVFGVKGKNLAIGKDVTASDSREAPDRWAASNLTDGKFAEWYPEPADGIRVKANDVDYWNEFLRKDNNRKTFEPPGAWEALFHFDRFEPAEPVVPPLVKASSPALTGLDPEQADGDKKWSVQFQIDQPIRFRLDSSREFLGFHGPGNEFKGWQHYIRFARGNEIEDRLRAIGKADLPKEEMEKARREMKEKILDEWRHSKEMWLSVSGVTFRGPLGKKDPPTHDAIFGNLKRGDGMPGVRQTLDRLALRLFRRPVDRAAMANYYRLAGDELGRDGGNAYGAVKIALNAMLCEPRFLFKHQGAGRELDDYMIASRLSYFLWDSAPDEELLELAAAGRLKDPEIRREQALRLLRDRERSDRFVDGFVDQWLGLEVLEGIAPNTAYIGANEFAALRSEFRQEPKAFFDHLLRGNLSATNIIHSDFVVWNGRILRHHQGRRARFPRPPKGEEQIPDDIFRPLPIAAEEEVDKWKRGGLLTMGAVLCMTSDGENQRPVLRGAWIARHLLGLEIEPPDTVPAIEVTLENVSQPREILKRHKEDASCYACHVKFDHLGLALENYDLLGTWRPNYVYPALDSEGKKFELVEKGAVDARSETPGGDPMHGVAGLKQHLLANREAVMRGLTEKLFGYALGREVRYLDRETIDRLLKRTAEEDYLLRDLVLELVASEAFGER